MSGLFAKKAIEYNDQNLAILPCGNSNGKIALVKWMALQEEYVDLSVFNEWLEKFPSANIGLITGPINKLTVIDCDIPGASLDDLQREFGETPLIVRTPRGGFHLYYRYGGEHSQNGFAEKIDIKSRGGYVIAPPSINPQTGKSYRFIKGTLEDIAKLPIVRHPRLPQKVIQKSIASLQERSERSDCARILEGERNNHLFRKVKEFAYTAHNYYAIKQFAEEHNNLYLTPPLPEQEVDKIVQSVWKYKQENRLWMRGEQHILVDSNSYFLLCKNPRALALYIFLLAKHKNRREDFKIVHEKVAGILGCEKKTIPKAIEYLIDKKKIVRTHQSTGKNDGHKYRFS